MGVLRAICVVVSAICELICVVLVHNALMCTHTAEHLEPAAVELEELVGVGDRCDASASEACTCELALCELAMQGWVDVQEPMPSP